MLRVRSLFLALVLAAATLAGTAGAEPFLSQYEDLPLAPGLTETLETGVSFDTPGGRIVDAYAHGAVATAEVLKFYATTLPQLGWTHVSDRQYRREAEVLRLEPVAKGRHLTIRFAITPE
ncbi:conserved exported hypothetical protein [Candidatus Terasakiella magnetica]|nr:conserved exported hypothetical protein [Candidatus Terasakiella magnetica]